MIFRPAWMLLPSAMAILAASTQRSARTLTVPAPYRTIQSAIDAAQPGDTVLLAAGTFDERLRIDKPITLKGAGGERTILTWDDDDQAAVLRVGGTGPVTISQLTLKPVKPYAFDKDKFLDFKEKAGCCIHTQADAVSFVELAISTGERIGIDVAGGNAVAIRACRIADSPAAGIAVRSAGRCVISRCILSNCWHAVWQDKGNVEFAENYVHHVRATYWAETGRCRIRGNLGEASGYVNLRRTEAAAVQRNVFLDMAAQYFVIACGDQELEIAENVLMGTHGGIGLTQSRKTRKAVKRNWTVGAVKDLRIQSDPNALDSLNDPPVEIEDNTFWSDQGGGVHLMEGRTANLRRNLIGAAESVRLERRAQALLVGNALASRRGIPYPPDGVVTAENNHFFASPFPGAAMPGTPRLPAVPFRRTDPTDYRVEGFNWKGGKGRPEDGKGPQVTLVRPPPWMISADGRIPALPADWVNRVMPIAGFAEDPGDVDVVLINGRRASCAPIGDGVAFFAEITLTGAQTPVVLEAVDFAGHRSQPIRFTVLGEEARQPGSAHGAHQ